MRRLAHEVLWSYVAAKAQALEKIEARRLAAELKADRAASERVLEGQRATDEHERRVRVRMRVRARLRRVQFVTVCCKAGTPSEQGVSVSCGSLQLVPTDL